MPIVNVPAATGPMFCTDVLTLIVCPTAARVGPDTESIARSGRTTWTWVGAVAPLSSSSDSSTTSSMSTTAETNRGPAGIPAGTVTAAVDRRDAVGGERAQGP